MQVGVGLTYLSGTDDILAGMVAQRSFFLGPPQSPLELKVKAHADYNTQTQQVRCLEAIFTSGPCLLPAHSLCLADCIVCSLAPTSKFLMDAL